MTLENWSVVDDPYIAPEESQPKIKGNVFGNPNFKDGDRVVTSTIVSINPEEKTVTTKSGSTYFLGEVDPEWEKEYPDAESRFWNNNPGWIKDK